MTVLHLALAAMLMLGPIPLEAAASQLDLYQAKQEGLVGETPYGLVAAVNPLVNPEMQVLIANVNKQRLKSYMEISEKRRITLKKVQALAGKKLIEKTPSGQLIMTTDGKWVRKITHPENE
jgi:hypothetical protein